MAITSAIVFNENTLGNNISPHINIVVITSATILAITSAKKYKYGRQ